MQRRMFDLVAPETLLMASLFVTGLLLFISVYFMITLSDLESDYLNSRQCSDKLNLFTWPRLALLALHSVLVIIGNWKSEHSTVFFLRIFRPFGSCYFLFRPHYGLPIAP